MAAFLAVFAVLIGVSALKNKSDFGDSQKTTTTLASSTTTTTTSSTTRWTMYRYDEESQTTTTSTTYTAERTGRRGAGANGSGMPVRIPELEGYKLDPKFTTTKRTTTKKKTTATKKDPYDVNDYANEEDFYDDHYDDFFDYYEAEDYFREHHD